MYVVLLPFGDAMATVPDELNYDSAAQDDAPVEIEDYGDEESEPLSWDEKARQAMRQILTQKVDLPISRLREMIDDKEIDLAPGFQRRLRWTRAQQSRLIESVIMNVPIPPVFLGEDQPGRYVVLDGRQRLTALYKYLGDEFRLSGLEVWHELNGKNFKQLKKFGEPPIASAITRRFVPAVLILHESVPEVKYEVFDRLNTGGVVAEPMEVRNAIYRGEFNKLLHEVSDTQEFRVLWGISTDDRMRQRNGTFKRMADLEMALRFFAFQDYRKFAGSLKAFLNDYMSNRNSAYKRKPSLKQEDETLFLKTMSRTLALLGRDAFHRTTSPGKRSPVPSAPFADAILYAISRLPAERDSSAEGERIRAALDRLCLEDPEFEKAITVGTNARTSAEYRIESATRAVLGLDPTAPIP
jgi:hypothetical protein